MTDKPVKLGALEIRNAKKLFEKSVADGKPDYRYPALVIGEFLSVSAQLRWRKSIGSPQMSDEGVH